MEARIVLTEAVDKEFVVLVPVPISVRVYYGEKQAHVKVGEAWIVHGPEHWFCSLRRARLTPHLPHFFLDWQVQRLPLCTDVEAASAEEVEAKAISLQRQRSSRVAQRRGDVASTTCRSHFIAFHVSAGNH